MENYWGGVGKDVKNILRVWSEHFTKSRDNPCHIPYSLLVIQIQNNVNQDIHLSN